MGGRGEVGVTRLWLRRCGREGWVLGGEGVMERLPAAEKGKGDGGGGVGAVDLFPLLVWQRLGEDGWAGRGECDGSDFDGSVPPATEAP